MTTKKIKDSCSPDGWPADQIIEPIKKVTEAEAAASFGLSREDFTDTGEDLEEFIELVEGN
jgi:hypothetical protein